MLRKIYILFTAVLLCLPGALVAQERIDGVSKNALKGYELFEAGQYRAAQTELLKAKESIPADALAEKMKVDYMLAQCVAKLGEQNAMAEIADFEKSYPGSIYSADLRFTSALCFFDEGRFEEALRELGNIDGFSLQGSRRDEYYFKKGYSEFMLGQLRDASVSMRQIRAGDYRSHAQYYTAYIDYTEGNYSAAKSGFKELTHDLSYGLIIPFYILQIEFLEGNYDYVISNGDELLHSSESTHRTAEIGRILAESWFHKEDYARTMQYMDIYRSNGGGMRREEFYLTGYSEYMNGHPTQAITALSQVVGADDKLTQNAAYHMAAAYLELDRKHEAMQSFSIAADGDYDPTVREDALFNYGKLQFELGGGVFNEAINVLSRYITEYPRSARVAEATEYLASAYYNARNYEAAYDAIKRIPNPDNNIRTAYQKISYFRALDLYNMGDYDRSYAMLEESLRNKFNPKYTALTQFWMGEILYREGEYDRAASLYKQYMAVSPSTEREYKMALYNLGYSHFNRKEWNESRNWFDKFLNNYTARDSYRADAYNRLGDIDFANREFWRAIEMFDNAAKIGSDEKYYSQLQRAMMLGYVDRQSRKVESLNDIIRAGHGGYVSDAMYELGLTYITMERFRDAAAAMRRFIETYPTDEKHAVALSDLGLIYQNLDDNDAAVNYYKLAVDKAPNSPEAKNAMMALRSIYVGMNDVDSYFAFASRSGVETDLGIVSRDSLAFTAAQNVYLQSGNTTGSVNALKNYLDRYPRGVYRPDALYYMGNVYSATGRSHEAILSYKELTGMYYNSYTVRALEKLAALFEQTERNKEAADTYKQLSTTAVNPVTINNALSGYLSNTVKSGNHMIMEAVADEIAALGMATEEVKRDAKFVKAEVLEQRGEKVAALTLYRELANESKTGVGAKSTLKVIESRYTSGDLDGAQKMILDFANQNTPFQYELGKAFLILGDIYITKEDTFQARATLQSIIDGYSPADDGIVAAARARIGKL